MGNNTRTESIYNNADQVESAFYEAFGSGNYTLMKTVYAKEGVSCTHPSSSPIKGRRSVLDNWKFVLDGIPPVKIDIEVLNVTKSEGMEVRQVVERFVVDGITNRTSEVHTTNIYVQQKDGWRLQMQHASLPKATQQNQTAKSTEAMNFMNTIVPQASVLLN